MSTVIKHADPMDRDWVPKAKQTVQRDKLFEFNKQSLMGTLQRLVYSRCFQRAGTVSPVLNILQALWGANTFPLSRYILFIKCEVWKN